MSEDSKSRMLGVHIRRDSETHKENALGRERPRLEGYTYTPGRDRRCWKPAEKKK